jgi:hypothetical protein
MIWTFLLSIYYFALKYGRQLLVLCRNQKFFAALQSDRTTLEENYIIFCYKLQKFTYCVQLVSMIELSRQTAKPALALAAVWECNFLLKFFLWYL